MVNSLKDRVNEQDGDIIILMETLKVPQDEVANLKLELTKKKLLHLSVKLHAKILQKNIHKILKGSKTLKDSENYKEVFINMDLTFAQRETQKQLLDEKKKLNAELSKTNKNEMYIIRNERLKLVEIQKSMDQ